MIRCQREGFEENSRARNEFFDERARIIVNSTEMIFDGERAGNVGGLMARKIDTRECDFTHSPLKRRPTLGARRPALGARAELRR